MNACALGFLGAAAAGVLMDVTESAMASNAVTRGVGVALAGRSAPALIRGRLIRADIRSSPALPLEAAFGWSFRFLVGGSGVALVFATLPWCRRMPSPARGPALGRPFGRRNRPLTDKPRRSAPQALGAGPPWS